MSTSVRRRPAVQRGCRAGSLAAEDHQAGDHDRDHHDADQADQGLPADHPVRNGDDQGPLPGHAAQMSPVHPHVSFRRRGQQLRCFRELRATSPQAGDRRNAPVDIQRCMTRTWPADWSNPDDAGGVCDTPAPAATFIPVRRRSYVGRQMVESRMSSVQEGQATRPSYSPCSRTRSHGWSSEASSRNGGRYRSRWIRNAPARASGGAKTVRSTCAKWGVDQPLRSCWLTQRIMLSQARNLRCTYMCWSGHTIRLAGAREPICSRGRRRSLASVASNAYASTASPGTVARWSISIGRVATRRSGRSALTVGRGKFLSVASAMGIPHKTMPVGRIPHDRLRTVRRSERRGRPRG